MNDFLSTMIEINSRDNQHLKFARRVRDGRVRESIFIEGVRLAVEAVRSELPIETVILESSFAESVRGAEILSSISGKAPIYVVSETLFNSIADTESPQGIVVLAKRPSGGGEAIAAMMAGKERRVPLVVMLHRVNNPANLGAVLRTAEAAGAAGVITTRGSTDAFAPKCLRSSMGSAFRLPVWESVEFETALQWARDHGLRVTAIDINGDLSVYDVDWRRGRLVIFGSEAGGLESEQVQFADESATIPMSSIVESLNLAVSSGIVLFEARRAANG